MIRINDDTLARVQRESGMWRSIAYPDTVGDSLAQLTGITEECGELLIAMGKMSHALLKYKQGIRGYDIEKTRAEVGDAMADAIIYMCAVADTIDLNVADELSKAWAHVRARNLVQNSDMGNSAPVNTAPVGCVPCATIPGQPCEHTAYTRAQFETQLDKLARPFDYQIDNIHINPVDDVAVLAHGHGEVVRVDYGTNFAEDPIPTHGHDNDLHVRADLPPRPSGPSFGGEPINDDVYMGEFIDDDITHDDDRWSLQEADDE